MHSHPPGFVRKRTGQVIGGVPRAALPSTYAELLRITAATPAGVA
nr:hypothetical protein [Micromonospora sp. RTGN7]